MPSKRKMKKMAKELLESLKEKIPKSALNSKPGKIVLTRRRPNKKDSRNRGRVVVYADDKDYPVQFVFWDEWNTWRDGQRDLYNRNKIYKIGFKRSGWRRKVYEDLKQLNAKLKKQVKIRKARREKYSGAGL